jgi:altronate hydrolase
MKNKLLRITPHDSVAVAIQPVAKGETLTVDGITVTALEDIPAGHKIALEAIKAGEPVIKYGYPIGAMKTDIQKGGHVHADNLHTLLEESGTYRYDEKQADAFKAKAEELKKGTKGTFPPSRRINAPMAVSASATNCGSSRRWDASTASENGW